MEVNEFESKLINLYAEAEFLGALNLGNFAKYVFDPYLKTKLVWHSLEEMRHAFILYDFLKKTNSEFIRLPLPEKGGFPSFYMSYTEDLIDFLVMIHLFELRAPFSYKWLILCTKNPEIIRISNQLIKDEEPHLSWIREFLQDQQKKGNKLVEEAFRKYIEG